MNKIREVSKYKYLSPDEPQGRTKDISGYSKFNLTIEQQSYGSQKH